MSRVIVEVGKKRYRVVKNGHCSKRGCSLYDADICKVDCDASENTTFPCDTILDAINDAGVCVSMRSTYKEVK